VKILQINNLSLKIAHQTVIDQFSMSVEENRITGLFGQSGSGKSSILKTILAYATEYTRYTGEILFKDEAISRVPRKKYQPVFQDPLSHFNPAWTLRDCLMEPLHILFAKIPMNEKEKKINSMLPDFNFQDAAILNKNILNFSGGELQRFAIMRALLCEPELLILDEPISALDVSVQKEILQLLKGLVKTKNISVLIVSHDLDAMMELCDYVYVIDAGRLVEQGEAKKVFVNPASEITSRLIQSRYLGDIKYPVS